MTNTNCLEAIRCPKCGNDHRLYISVKALAVVTDDGSEVYGDHEWDDDSATECPECGHAGKVRDFRMQPDSPDDEITVSWHVGDVLEVCPHLTRDQAREVLQSVERGHDANIGINWEVLRGVASVMFPESEDDSAAAGEEVVHAQ